MLYFQYIIYLIVGTLNILVVPIKVTSYQKSPLEYLYYDARSKVDSISRFLYHLNDPVKELLTLYRIVNVLFFPFK